MIFLSRERKSWMRLASHTVVFDTEPDFHARMNDASGVIMRILHIWLAEPCGNETPIRAYVGSVRFSSGWYSRRELFRLFRRARASAVGLGMNVANLRSNLSDFLREYFQVTPVNSTKN
jgi:hypothetical protein